MASRHEITGTFLGIRPRCEWENDDGTITIIGTVRVDLPKAEPTEPAAPTEPTQQSRSADCPWCEGVGDGPCVCPPEAESPLQVDATDDRTAPPQFTIKTIKDQIPRNGLRVGMTYRFYGLMRSYENRRTGVTEDQFQFDSYVMEEPAGQEAIVAYLSQCRGIGPKTAFDLYKQFGEEAIEKVRECPDEIARSLPRFSMEKAREASALLQSRQKNERAKIDLLGLLKGRRFPKTIVEKLIGDYGVQAAVVAHRNPYALMRYRGVGFLKTDKMYLDLRHNPSRMKRQALCGWHAIAKQGSGDTWFPFSYVRDGLRQNISSAAVDVERAMQLAIRGRMLSETYHCGQRWVAERTKAQQEEQIAKLIDEARHEFRGGIGPVIWSQLSAELDGITDHQRDNLRQATTEFIGVLAGRPGTGKTYTVARLVAKLADLVGEQHIAIAAPTGKAAVRVTAAMNAVGLSLRASTIHSLLEFAGDLGFRYCRGNPLPYKFVIVDESSMIDTALMRSLLEARAEGCHILFVGDPNQLAPVGHGAPLRDFIMANVAHGTLTEIQRNSGRIVKACGEIIDKRRLTPSPKLDLATGENLLLIERDTPDVQIETLTAVMQNYQKKAEADDAEAGPLGPIDPIWDVQIVVAVNKKSQLGRKPLNGILQQLLNPNGQRVAGNPFRVGDKIINTKNGSYKSAVKDPEECLSSDTIADDALGYTFEDFGEKTKPAEPSKVYVANGEQAEVLEVTSTRIIARLTSPDRTILIPRSAKADSEDGDGPPPSDDGNESEESTGSGCAWELGYAISCHKSQGSEWPVVIVMLDDYNGAKMVQSKQWIYTAISRAKKLCLMIGKASNANDMCQRDALFKRKTFLKEQIIALREVRRATGLSVEATQEPTPPGAWPVEIEWTDKLVEKLLEGVC